MNFIYGSISCNEYLSLPMIGLLFKSPENEAERMNGDDDIKSIQTSLKVFISSVSMSSLNECRECTQLVFGVFEFSKQTNGYITTTTIKGGNEVPSGLK